MSYVAKIRCDWCKRERPLREITRRFWAFRPTRFICADCKTREQGPQKDS